MVDGQPLYQHLAALLVPLATARKGKSGISSLGSVAGATWPQEAEARRAALVDAPFLIPGFGAQGAGAGKATSGLTRGKHGWESGLINSTRGLIFPKKAAAAGSLDELRHEIAETIAEN